MDKTTCFVVDDEKEACLRMCEIIKNFPELELTGFEQNAEAAIQKIIKTKPDIVFVDIEMPRKNGFEVMEEVRGYNINPTFIFVTAYNHYAINALKESAFDYLLKPVDIKEFKETIGRHKKCREAFLSFERTNLTEREKQVAHLLCRGKTSKEIGEILFISKHTVDTHRKTLLKKLGFKTTNELIASSAQNR